MTAKPKNRITTSKTTGGLIHLVKIDVEEDRPFRISIQDNPDKEEVSIDFIYPDGGMIRQETLYYGNY